jgi:hypothetical protein
MKSRNRMWSLIGLLAAVLMIAGCAKPLVRQVAQSDLSAAQEHSAFLASTNTAERAGHRTLTTIEDVTDPKAPKVLYAKEGNLIGSCGVRALMASVINRGIANGGVCYTGSTPGVACTNDLNCGSGSLCVPSMGDVSGSGETLGTYCAGTLGGYQRVAWPYSSSNTVTMVIGPISAEKCTGSGAPAPCCTGSGTGCTVSNLDIMTFAEGQPNSTLTNAQANYTAWIGAGKPNAPAEVLATPSLYWDASSLEGIQFVATADGSSANGWWCETAVRPLTSGSSYPYGGVAFGPVYSGSRGVSWQLNHAVINPCIQKSAGTTWRLTQTIKFQ